MYIYVYMYKGSKSPDPKSTNPQSACTDPKQRVNSTYRFLALAASCWNPK